MSTRRIFVVLVAFLLCLAPIAHAQEISEKPEVPDLTVWFNVPEEWLGQSLTVTVSVPRQETQKKEAFLTEKRYHLDFDLEGNSYFVSVSDDEGNSLGSKHGSIYFPWDTRWYGGRKCSFTFR